jgi:hypothetical protein
MTSRNLRLNVFAAVLVCGTAFFAGCGDDDDNPSPSKGGSSGQTGGKGGKGGTSGEGGNDESGGRTGGTGGTGGTKPSSGGDAGTGNEGGGATGGAGGGGGEPSTGGTAGSGGDAGGGGVVELPPCESLNKDKCYENCAPKTSEHLLNFCSDARAQCTPFDNSTLTKLSASGELPDLPN